MLAVLDGGGGDAGRELDRPVASMTASTRPPHRRPASSVMAKARPCIDRASACGLFDGFARSDDGAA